MPVGWGAWTEERVGKRERMRIVGNFWSLKTLAVPVIAFGMVNAHGEDPAETLEQDFVAPPMNHRPFAWWNWMGNNVSKAGITRDFEAMKDAGITGVTMKHEKSLAGQGVCSNAFSPEVSYYSPAWLEMIRYTAQEANRLGLAFGIQNCPGFSASGGPWISVTQSMQRVVWTRTRVKGPASVTIKLPQPQTVLDYYRDIAIVAVPDGKAEIWRVTEVTDRMKSDGTFSWSVPEGAWDIYRFGHTSTGKRPHPCPEEIEMESLEADKLSSAAMTHHFESLLEPLKRELGPLLGKGFTHLLMDSYEAGTQDWTPGFRDIFRARRGYDVVPWLPVLAGHTLTAGGVSMNGRFKEDFDGVIHELFTENCFRLFQTITHQYGLKTHIEPYGGPFDPYEAAACADVPMIEFWAFPTFWSTNMNGGYPGVAGAVGRALGRTVIGAESFTAMPSDAAWREAPRHYKRGADISFANGINRLSLTAWVHQPFRPDLMPGMTVGWWGSHLGETQTWHEPGKAFYRYLGRCQALLQRGEQVVDVLCLSSSPGAVRQDAIPESVFLNDLSVRDGRVVLPSGRTYALLRLPDTDKMDLAVARKLEALLKAGATVVGRRPTRVPGLRGYPGSDAVLKTIADQLWGADRSASEHRFGKGRLVWGQSPDEVLAANGILPGLLFLSGNAGEEVRWTHRRDGKLHLFFLTNPTDQTREGVASFRVAGLVPEIWDPYTMKRETAACWDCSGGRTTVRLSFAPNQSFFVVFRKSAGAEDPIVKVGSPGARKLEILGAVYRSCQTKEQRDITDFVRQKTGIGSLHLTVMPKDLGGDPFVGHQKELELTYALDGKRETRIWRGGQRVVLPEGHVENDSDCWTRDDAGGVVVYGKASARLAAVTRSGKRFAVRMASAVPPLSVSGPWQVAFDPRWGGPAHATFDRLMSWSQSSETGVKYYSGTAVYTNEVDIPSDALKDRCRVWLDLGDVRELADVTLNGKCLGVAWAEPFRLDVSDVVHAGTNRLTLKVTNTWANRLIGDAQEPDDCLWGPLLYSKDVKGRKVCCGSGLLVYPDWLLQGRPRPSRNRYGFSIWNYFAKDSPLLEAGLLGPVRFVFEPAGILHEADGDKL